MSILSSVYTHDQARDRLSTRVRAAVLRDGNARGGVSAIFTSSCPVTTGRRDVNIAILVMVGYSDLMPLSLTTMSKESYAFILSSPTRTRYT